MFVCKESLKSELERMGLISKFMALILVSLLLVSNATVVLLAVFLMLRHSVPNLVLILLKYVYICLS